MSMLRRKHERASACRCSAAASRGCALRMNQPGRNCALRSSAVSGARKLCQAHSTAGTRGVRRLIVAAVHDGVALTAAAG